MASHNRSALFRQNPRSRPIAVARVAVPISSFPITCVRYTGAFLLPFPERSAHPVILVVSADRIRVAVPFSASALLARAREDAEVAGDGAGNDEAEPAGARAASVAVAAAQAHLLLGRFGVCLLRVCRGGGECQFGFSLFALR